MKTDRLVFGLSTRRKARQCLKGRKIMKVHFFKGIKATNMICIVRNKDQQTGERTGKVQCIHAIFCGYQITVVL